MRATLLIDDTLEVQVNFLKPIPIGIPVYSNKESVSAWGVKSLSVTPVKSEGFVGEISKGASVNFKTLQINPHGNGTHTECVGHIMEGDYFVGDCLKQHLFFSQLISVTPESIHGDLQITAQLLQEELAKVEANILSKINALIIRTNPNNIQKKTKNYTGSNPPYLSQGAMDYINQLGVQHLLIDLPSVDKENDGGALRAHKTFWGVPNDIQFSKTLTELVFVPSAVKDGAFILELSVPLLNIDALPSNPILYSVNK